MKKAVAIFICVILLLSLGSVSFAKGVEEGDVQDQDILENEENLPPTTRKQEPSLSPPDPWTRAGCGVPAQKNGAAFAPLRRQRDFK